MIDDITPIILTYNEAPNIGRCIERLAWAKRIVVVDSGSDDETLSILSENKTVEVLNRAFDTHASQWNFALEKANSTWVLALDADYILSDEFLDELKSISSNGNTNAYTSDFVYCVLGKPLKSSLLPAHPVLFKREKGSFYDDGHTQRVKVSGSIESLKGSIYHDDRKPFDRWLWAQQRYTKLEAKKLLAKPIDDLRLSDKIRKRKVIAPFVILVYTLFVKGLITEGWTGIYYALQRTVAEILLSLRLIEIEYLRKE